MDKDRAATIEEIKGFFQEIRELYRETDRKMQETDRQMRETDRKIGELGNRLGEFVEAMVKPSAVALFRERGLDVRYTMRDLSYFDGEGGVQVDLLVKNGKEVVVVECKSKLSVDDVNDHLDRLAKFKKYFPDFSDNHVMGAVAAMIIPEDVSRYAYKKGLFVMAQHGELMKILNDEKFKPEVW